VTQRTFLDEHAIAIVALILAIIALLNR